MNERLNNGIGSRLRDIRRQTGLSQKNFGSALGVSLPTISRIENGQRYPDAELLTKLRAEYQCDINWLLTGYRFHTTGKKVAGGNMGYANIDTETFYELSRKLKDRLAEEKNITECDEKIHATLCMLLNKVDQKKVVESIMDETSDNVLLIAEAILTFAPSSTGGISPARFAVLQEHQLNPESISMSEQTLYAVSEAKNLLSAQGDDNTFKAFQLLEAIVEAATFHRQPLKASKG